MTSLSDMSVPRSCLGEKGLLTQWVLLLLSAYAFAQSSPSEEELSRHVPEARRAAVKESLRLAGDNAGQIAEALVHAPEAQRDWMSYLIAYMPQPDLATMTSADLLENVALAERARKEFPYAQGIPEDVWLTFVLPFRSGHEPFERYRKVFLEEIGPRVKKMRSSREAALEVNRWCNENATFQSTTQRDQGPLTTRKRRIARCGEEMVFYIAAARSVGVPARAVFTRFWPFMDNNHAWVEVYADGGWHYLGACEPAADLDQAWFTAAASRAAIVQTVAYGVLSGPQVYRTGRTFTVLNTTSVYGPTGRLRVRLTKGGAPAQGRAAFVSVFNFGGLRPILRVAAGADGAGEVEAGLGDYFVSAGEGDALAWQAVTIKGGETTEASLDLGRPRPFEGAFWLRYPTRPRPTNAAGHDAPAADPRLAELEGQVRDLRRRVAGLEDRAASPDLLAFLREAHPWIGPFTEVLVDSAGNWKEILAAAKQLDEAERKDLLDLLKDLPTKDRIEVSAGCLVEHVRLAREARARGFAKDDALYRSNVLAARVWEEPVSPWRAKVLSYVKDLAREDAAATARAVNEWIAARCEVREPEAIGNSMTPADVLVVKGGSATELSACAVGCLRALGIPAHMAQGNRWAEFHDGKGWRPLYPKDPSNLGNEHRDAAATAQYAKKGTIAATFRRHGEATTKVEDGREYALMAFKDGASDDVEAEERREKDQVFMAVPPGKYVLFAGTRNSTGEPYVRPFPVNVEEGKEVALSIDLDLPAEEVAKQRLAERKMERAPELAGHDWKGSSVLFLRAAAHEPSERMLPLVQEWVERRKDTAKLIVLDVDSPGLADAFRLPRDKDGRLSSLPAVIWIKDGAIEMWEEGYNLAIEGALDETWTRISSPR